jgi:hypothetical protein
VRRLSYQNTYPHKVKGNNVENCKDSPEDEVNHETSPEEVIINFVSFILSVSRFEHPFFAAIRLNNTPPSKTDKQSRYKNSALFQKIRVPSSNILDNPKVNRLKNNSTDKSVDVVTNKPGKHDISK